MSSNKSPKHRGLRQLDSQQVARRFGVFYTKGKFCV